MYSFTYLILHSFCERHKWSLLLKVCGQVQLKDTFILMKIIWKYVIAFLIIGIFMNSLKNMYVHFSVFESKQIMFTYIFGNFLKYLYIHNYVSSYIRVLINSVHHFCSYLIISCLGRRQWVISNASSRDLGSLTWWYLPHFYPK